MEIFHSQIPIFNPSPNMEVIDSTQESNTLEFKGKGITLVPILLLNLLFTFFTLGLYYPWARVNKLKFVYGNIYLNQTPFLFHGTGKELFKGFIKLFMLVIVGYGTILYAEYKQDLFLVIISGYLFLLAILIIIPLAIHGAFRYRLSRTSWRSIHLGYRGERGQLVLQYWIGIILSTITLGLYYPWFIDKMRKYIIGHCRFGNLQFGYDGHGSDLFLIYLKGFFLSIFTLGIYYFWYKKEYLNYLIQYSFIEQEGKKFHLKGTISGTEFFILSLTNFLLTLFTFGLAIPWVMTRTIDFMVSNVILPASIDFNEIAQTEDEYLDASGEDVLDYLDIGVI